MRLLINTASVLKGGGAQVAASFIEECIEHTEHDYHVILGEGVARIIKTGKFPSNFTFYSAAFRPGSSLLSMWKMNRWLKAQENFIQPHCVFTTSGPAYWKPKAKHLMGYNIAQHIYPESPFFGLISLKSKIRWKIKKAIAKYAYSKQADAIVTQTEAVQKRIQQWLHINNVFLVHNTCSAAYFQPSSNSKVLPEKPLGTLRLLTISAFYPHKNLGIIKEVIKILEAQQITNIQFVLTLPEDVFKRAFETTNQQYLYNAGVVNTTTGVALYQESDIMFLPTLLECFSASYAEAMITGTPILTSDYDFAKSVCADAALYVDALNANDIATQIMTLQNNEQLRKTLSEAGKKRIQLFPSPAERATAYLNICEKLIQS
ncbi:MAG: glycosyltransferase [Ferruginibacter sp.]